MKRFTALGLSLILLLCMIPTALAGGFEVTTYQELLQKLNEPGNQTLYIDQSLAPNQEFGWPAEPVTLTVSKTLNLMTAWTVPEQVTLQLEGNGQVTGDTLIMNGTLDLTQSRRGSNLPVSNLELYGRLVERGKALTIGDTCRVTLCGGELRNLTQINLIGTLAGSGVLEVPVCASGLLQTNPPASHPVLSGDFTLARQLSLGDNNRATPVELTIPEHSSVRCMDGVTIGEHTVLNLNGSLEAFGRGPDTSPELPADAYLDDVRFVKNGRLVLGSSGLLSLRDQHTAKCIKEPYGWQDTVPPAPCVTGTGTVRCTRYYAGAEDQGYLLFGAFPASSSDRAQLDKIYLEPTVKLDLQLHPMADLLLEELSPAPQLSDGPHRAELEEALSDPKTATSGLTALKHTGFVQDLARETGVAADQMKIRMQMEVQSYEPAAGLTLELTPQVVLSKNGTEEVRTFPAGSTRTNRQPVTLSVRLPSGMTEPNMARHQLLGGGTELLPVTVADGVASWQQSSFSPVTLFQDTRSITLTFPDVPEAEREQTYTSADVGKQFPTVAEVEGRPRFYGWIFTLDGKWDGEYCQELTDELLTRLCEAETVDIQWVAPREHVYTLEEITVKEGTPFPQGSFTLQVRLYSQNYFNVWDDLVMASYDQYGKQLELKVVDAPKTAGEQTVEIQAANHNGEVAKVKLFTLPRYGTIMPLSNPIELSKAP